ncbi:unnamed protein product [Peronospora destructor]|uniref:Secreted protein n=1 Tax=Peronospora destructor TaxID=86335 RepID=A0AAV0UE43_9STRA|nr:unnamed protein product [Peronospora destructor]
MLAFAVLPAVPPPDAVASPNAVAEQPKVQLARFSFEQLELLCVSLDIAGLHRAQRAVDDVCSLHPPPLVLQLCHDRLVLECLVIMAKL